MKDVIKGELKIGIRRIPNRASVLLNEHMKLKQIEYCSARVPVQPRVQQNFHEQNLSKGHEIQVPTTQLPIDSGGRLKRNL